jgi:hypothetical protein
VTLAGLLAEAAAALDGPIDTTTTADGTVTWSLGDRPFATLDAAGTTASFGLDAVLAGAARRTPDTGPSTRGEAWVSFHPAELDGHAEDRARAWFAAAARRASS